MDKRDTKSSTKEQCLKDESNTKEHSRESSTKDLSLKNESKFGDSNYGSLEQLEEGSSSSTPFSFSSDSANEIDTTSISQGSSCMSFDTQTRKRDKVKDCLHKLKNLMPPTKQIKKGSRTVFALRQALNHMKHLQGTGDSSAKFSIKIAEIQDIVRTKQGAGAGASSTNNCVLAVHQGKILQCSSQLEQILGYPKDYLCNHSFRAIVHHRDEQTISFCMQGSKSSTSCDEEVVDEGLAMAEGPREIYFRMQCFKSLRHGFSVTSTDYLTLHATITLATKTVEHESESGDVATKKKTYGYYILNCTELKPAYKVPMEVPEVAIFSTRHSTYCLYTYMHPSMIQCLGYLPSDVENTSIFNLYHPNDMLNLYNMYEQVIKAGAGATRSKPYRLRVKNDDYIMVETTWSCFVDPWTKKLEFLVGQHKVLQGPQHLDIFSGRSSTSLPVSVEVEYFRKKIKDLLMMAGKSIVAAQKMIEDVHAPVQPPADDARTLDSNSPLELQAEEDLEDMSGGITRVTASYNQVSYSQIIRNFLMTCPQTVFDPEIPTISMISKKLLSTTAKGVHYDENTRVPVANLSTVKPPSFCSSTKALLSEPEPMSPNPAKEMDPLDETVPQGGEVYKPTKLTKTALKRHTKTQEQFFLQQMATAEAKELMRMPEPCEHIKTGTKRPLESDECKHGTAKRVRGLEPPPAATASSSWGYQPIMEYSEMDFSASQYGNVTSGPQDFHHLSCSQRMMGLSQNPPAVHGGKAVPSHHSLSPGELTDNTFNESLVSVGGGMSSPHIDDTEGLSDPDISVSSSLFSLPSRIKMVEDEGDCMAKPLYWPGRIMTVPAWLMIQNWNESSVQGYKLPVQDMKTVLLKDSQWLDCSVQSDYVNKQLNTAVGECKAVVNDSDQFFLFEPYQLPMLKDIELSTTSCSSYEMKDKAHPIKHKIKRSRSKNDIKVNKVKLALIKKAKEEKKQLCSMKPLGSVDAEKCDSGEMSAKCDSGLGTGERSIGESPSFSEQAKYAKGMEENVKEHASMEKPLKSASPNSESKCDLESNSSNNDHDSTESGNDRDSNCGNDQDSNTSSNERDLNDPDRSSSPSNSKGEGDSDISSGITPSDQRSTGEVNSSLKESDGVSSKESGSTHSNSHCKPSINSTLTQSHDDAFMSFFNRLFVPSVERKRPLPQYPSTNTKVNPWLEDVGLNKKLEMEYTMESKKLGDVLDENNRLSSKIEQSEMVRLQLDEFLEDVMKVGQAKLCEDHGNQEKTYSQFLDILNPSGVDTKESYWTDMTKAMEIEGDLLTQADQSMTIVMSNKHKESDQDMMGSKSSSSGSQNQSSNSSNKLMAVPHEKRSVCSKSTHDSGLGSSMISSSKDSASASGQDKESSCSFKRSDEESSDTGRGKHRGQTSSKGSDGDGDASMHCS